MADFIINVFLDEDKQKKIEGAGLGDQIQDLEGKKMLQVGLTKKEQKKLIKGFPDLNFDDNNTCVLPGEAEDKLVDIIAEMGTLDVMKVAIMKLYNPLAGKAPRAARFS